jgi:hypothetical protein
MANRILAGYSQPVGEKIEIVFDHDGPTSYVNSGTFATSGDQINASDFGLGGIEYVEVDNLSSDGVNAVQIVLGATIAGATNLQPAPATSPGPVAVTAVIHWYTSPSSGTEVANGVNLSGKYIRLRIRGV